MNNSSSTTIPQRAHQQDQAKYQIINLLQILNQKYHPYLILLNFNFPSISDHLISSIVFIDGLIGLLNIQIKYFIIKILYLLRDRIILLYHGIFFYRIRGRLRHGRIHEFILYLFTLNLLKLLRFIILFTRIFIDLIFLTVSL
jgi:hypothetical protein